EKEWFGPTPRDALRWATFAWLANRSSRSVGKRERRLEAPPGFEPGVEVLQTSALPLGDGAPEKQNGGSTREAAARIHRPRNSPSRLAALRWTSVACQPSVADATSHRPPSPSGLRRTASARRLARQP